MISTGNDKVTELRLHRQEKAITKAPRRRSGRMILFISVAVVGYVVFSLSNQFNNLHLMQSNVEDLQKQVQELQNKNATIREEIKQIKSDSYVEQVAREQLGLVKPGETLVVPAQTSLNGESHQNPPEGQENAEQGEGFNVRYKNIYD